ncbi:oocyte zinc finger protein XlCOF8.4-like isoform X2 [Hyperolius riggenbachi]|uniref:oocyte zinc finger protein XlCOF8.4-like isoform X2 n=1 Tax=Hyperolius riggenbachi TaxID=752182 RepID=UPI0035A31C14
MMEEDHNHVTERIFNLTLEIFYLLTGEKYAAVKMTAIESLLQGMCPALSGVQSRNESTKAIPSPHTLISGKNNKKKIVEVTNKITELLSGEVPIRCQDVTFYFSMEARGNSEGHKDPYKNIKVENHQILTSPDGPCDTNPTERCAGPLYSQDCAKENHSHKQQNQGKDQITIKTELQEEVEETHVRTNALHEEKEIPLEDNTGGQNFSRTSEEHLISSPTSENHDGISNYFPGINSGTSNMQHEEYSIKSNADTPDVQQRLHGLDTPLHPPIDMGHLSNKSHFAISNIHQELYREEQSSGLATLEETTHKSVPATSNIHPGFLAAYGPSTHSTHEESSPCVMIQPTLQNSNEIYQGSNSWKCIPTLAYQNEHQQTQKCDQSFRSVNHRSTSGQKRHLGKKLFPCTECGKCFNHIIELLKHQQEHRKIRPYSCSDCGRSYTHKSHLLNHQRLHTGVNTFPCLECGRCFTLKSQFIQHMRSHTGEKPFSCTECGRCFAKKSNLDNHQTVHTGFRPFSCSVCGKKLARKTTLRQHLRAHAGDL